MIRAQIGGVNPQFFGFKNGPAPYAEYDSWLTVGMTEGESPTAISVIGDDVNSWSETKALTTEDGAIFWMNPGDGPSVTDANGKAGTGSPKGNIVVAQLTVKTGTSFDARLNCQGLTSHGDNWESTNIKFHVGSAGVGGREAGSHDTMAMLKFMYNVADGVHDGATQVFEEMNRTCNEISVRA
jgi:hypothetical protein